MSSIETANVEAIKTQRFISCSMCILVNNSFASDEQSANILPAVPPKSLTMWCFSICPPAFCVYAVPYIELKM